MPSQDKDYLVAFAQLPDAATLDRTEAVIRDMSAIALKHPGSPTRWRSLACRSTTSSTPRTPGSLRILKPADQRAGQPGLDAQSIVMDLNRQFAGLQDAFVAIFPPPAVQGLGQVGGFKLYVEDRAGLGFEELYSQVQASLGQGRSDPALAGLFSSFQVSVPQIDAKVDRDRAKTYGVNLNDVFETLQVYLGRST